ncbi:MAG: LuxR C-terminal-related transcriptional regulator [Clostridium sp.]
MKGNDEERKNKSSLLVKKENINKLLNEIYDVKIIYIHGPIGCGKTTAVREWCNSIDEEVLWYSIDENGIESNKLIDTLTKRVKEAEKKKKIIVIDNFERLKDKDKILFSIIDEIPKEYKLIFISCFAIPNGLKYFLVKRELEIINYVDFLFNDEEILDYFKINGFNIDDENLKKIKKVTEGWVIGLNGILGALKLNENEFNEQMYRDAILNAYAFLDYRVFERLDENIKDFAIELSLLDEIDLGIFKFIAKCKNIDNIEKIFKELFDGRIFFIKIRPRVYKYINYIKKYLKYKMEKRYSKDDINKMYGQIAEYYINNNEEVKALDYYCNGGYYKEAIEILEKLSNVVYINLNIKIINKYIDIIPKEYLNKSPVLCAARFLNQFIYQKGDLQETYKNLIDMRELIPKEGIKRAQLEAVILYAKIAIKMEPKKILESFKECKHILAKNNYHLSATCLMLNIPSVLRGVRDFSSWSIHYKFVESMFRENIKEMFANESLGLLDIAIAEVLYERNDLNNALMKASKGVAASYNGGSIEVYFLGILILIKILRAQGQSYKIKEIIQVLENRIEEEKAIQLEENMKALKVRIELTLGNLDYALNWVSTLPNGIMVEEFSINKMFFYISIIRTYIYNNMYTQALIGLESVSANLKNLNRILDMIEINILRAMCYYKYNEEEKAFSYIDYAIKSAFRYNYVRIFADEGKLCAIILNKYLRNRHDLSLELKKYVKKLINAANKSAILSPKKMTNQVNQVVKSLTKSEEEVLNLLMDGFKYADISEQLNIKISTVKTHISNIYSKLNVKNKNEAMLVIKNMRKD